MYEIGERLPGGKGPTGYGVDHGEAPKGLAGIGEELTA